MERGETRRRGGSARSERELPSGPNEWRLAPERCATRRGRWPNWTPADGALEAYRCPVCSDLASSEEEGALVVAAAVPKREERPWRVADAGRPSAPPPPAPPHSGEPQTMHENEDDDDGTRQSSMRPLVIASPCDDLVGDYLKGVVNVLGHIFLRHALSNFEVRGDPLRVPGPRHGDEVPATFRKSGLLKCGGQPRGQRSGCLQAVSSRRRPSASRSLRQRGPDAGFFCLGEALRADRYVRNRLPVPPQHLEPAPSLRYGIAEAPDVWRRCRAAPVTGDGGH